MSYLGDYTEDYATLNFKFTSRTTSGVPIVLAGTPIISVYTGSATGTEVTTGVTLAVDFDNVVGLNNVLIDLSSAAFYATGADYHVVITQGTVNSVSVVGEVVATFSIENRFVRGTDSAALAVNYTSVRAARLDADISSRATPAQVNTEVLDVVNVDTVTLPGQVVPPLAPTMREMQSWLYKVLRNRKDQTATLWQLYADDESTVDAKATVSSNGTTAIKQEIVAGP